MEDSENPNFDIFQSINSIYEQNTQIYFSSQELCFQQQSQEEEDLFGFNQNYQQKQITTQFVARDDYDLEISFENLQDLLKIQSEEVKFIQQNPNQQNELYDFGQIEKKNQNQFQLMNEIISQDIQVNNNIYHENDEFIQNLFPTDSKKCLSNNEIAELDDLQQVFKKVPNDKNSLQLKDLPSQFQHALVGVNIHNRDFQQKTIDEISSTACSSGQIIKDNDKSKKINYNVSCYQELSYFQSDQNESDGTGLKNEKITKKMIKKSKTNLNQKSEETKNLVKTMFNQCLPTIVKRFKIQMGNKNVEKLMKKYKFGKKNEESQGLQEIKSIQDIKELVSIDSSVKQAVLDYFRYIFLRQIAKSKRLLNKRTVMKYLDKVIECIIDPENFQNGWKN